MGEGSEVQVGGKLQCLNQIGVAQVLEHSETCSLESARILSQVPRSLKN
jgi:hypothetical protein